MLMDSECAGCGTGSVTDQEGPGMSGQWGAFDLFMAGAFIVTNVHVGHAGRGLGTELSPWHCCWQ